MFFGILSFDPKWGFCKGYSLCMMADFQNALISRIFSVSSSRFLHRTTLNNLDFDMFFGILNFDPKWGFLKGYSLCMMADFQNVLILEYEVFFWAVFCTEQLWMICKMHFDIFFGILIFDQKWGFCKGYSLCIMADFQNALISRIFTVFSIGFLPRTTLNDL